jgi:hypothetical protein
LADLVAQFRDRQFFTLCAGKPVEPVFWLCGHGHLMMGKGQFFNSN